MWVRIAKKPLCICAQAERAWARAATSLGQRPASGNCSARYSQIARLSQIVMSPGVNDGDVLRRTLADLYAFGPAVLGCSVVPVGLTEYSNRDFVDYHSDMWSYRDGAWSLVTPEEVRVSTWS
mgnify:CR=1 FL=1